MRLIGISFCLYIILPLIRSECFSKSSTTMVCDGHWSSIGNQTEFVDYQSIFNRSETLENFFLTNYQLTKFPIDYYPLTLHLLNASGNRFSSLIIKRKSRKQSNLRQLILQSNELEQLNIRQVYFPPSLERISLAHNRLTVLGARLFSHLTNLIELNLRDNRLRRMLPELVLRINVLLDGNPLDCHCTTDDYRSICDKATTLPATKDSNDHCAAPHYDPNQYDVHPPPYLRFSTFVLICPISAQPPPLIVWSTPFGKLIAMNGSRLDLLNTGIDEPLYINLTAIAGPLTTRTRHVLRAFHPNRLSVTRARAALEQRFSCSGINMLGNYRYDFEFRVDSNVKPRALWQLLYTFCFGVFISLVAGALCVTTRHKNYYTVDEMRTPPIYPTLTPNSAARTPPNFEFNQWFSTAAANISGTLEQVRDKLRIGVQHVSGQMGRASELLSHSVQHAAVASAAYFQSFREASQEYLNTMRVQTSSSLRNSGQFMRSGMNMLTTQVNSLRDYCGETTGVPLTTNYLLQQQQSCHAQYSPSPISHLHHGNRITTITEEDEDALESNTLINSTYPTPYAGHIASHSLRNESGIGRLNVADNSALFALSNFNRDTADDSDAPDEIVHGHLTAGLGTFHSHTYEPPEEAVHESEQFTLFGRTRDPKN